MELKDLILLDLKRDQGFVSGEELSAKAGVSRTAVWKAVRQLRSEGYVIESAQNKGYRLVGSPDLLSPAEILSGLKTDVLGRQIVYMDRADSTNTVAKARARSGAPHGTLVVAEEQTSGRGRLGRPWQSRKGAGLWFSVILRPAVPLSAVSQITSVAGIAVASSLRSLTGSEYQLKWPNDVMYQGRKICGVLVEMSAEMDRVEFVILGVGINVKGTHEDFGAELRDKAGTVEESCGRPVRRVAVLQAVLSGIETYYTRWAGGGFPGILDEIRRTSCTIGRKVHVSMVNGAVDGEAIGIDDDGALIVMDETGQQRKIYSGDVGV